MDRLETLNASYEALMSKGVVRSKRDFANLLGVNESSLCQAFKGNPRYLTQSLVSKVVDYTQQRSSAAIPEEWVREFPALDPVGTETPASTDQITILPIEAMAGTLGEFVDSVQPSDCERMISPIKGAEFAIKVSGDSMSPVYPSGSLVLIKKVNENAFIEWGKVYVLDTANGPVIKKVMNTAEKNVVECISLNSDYPPFTIDTSYIFGWYRVLMVMFTQ